MKFLKWLGFEPEKHSVRTEILAGLTTFLTMAYIMAVNPKAYLYPLSCYYIVH